MNVLTFSHGKRICKWRMRHTQRYINCKNNCDQYGKSWLQQKKIIDCLGQVTGTASRDNGMYFNLKSITSCELNTLLLKSLLIKMNWTLCCLNHYWLNYYYCTLCRWLPVSLIFLAYAWVLLPYSNSHSSDGSMIKLLWVSREWYVALSWRGLRHAELSRYLI